MNEDALHARLVNSGGELLAEGLCWLDERNAQATLEPAGTPAPLRKERGPLTLQLDSGRTIKVSDKLMVVRITPPGHYNANAKGNGRRSLYRLRLLSNSPAGLTIRAQDAEATGAAGEGTPASRFGEETPAAR